MKYVETIRLAAWRCVQRNMIVFNVVQDLNFSESENSPFVRLGGGTELSSHWWFEPTVDRHPDTLSSRGCVPCEKLLPQLETIKVYSSPTLPLEVSFWVDSCTVMDARRRSRKGSPKEHLRVKGRKGSWDAFTDFRCSVRSHQDK
eukprot:4589205-Amphidinium_carterae.1